MLRLQDPQSCDTSLKAPAKALSLHGGFHVGKRCAGKSRGNDEGGLT